MKLHVLKVRMRHFADFHTVPADAMLFELAEVVLSQIFVAASEDLEQEARFAVGIEDFGPKLDNVRIYLDAVIERAEGYIPVLQCRQDSST